MAERAKAKKASAKKAPKGAQGSRGKVAKTDPKPEIGHNSGTVSPALIKTHHEKLDGIEERMEKARQAMLKVRGEHRAYYAVVKQDGVDLDAFKLARDLHKQDHGIVVTTYSKVGEYLQGMKSELATQMDLFQDMAPPPSGDAKLAGAQAFGNSEPRSNNPHTQGTELYAMWDEGWLEKANVTPLKDGEGATIN